MSVVHAMMRLCAIMIPARRPSRDTRYMILTDPDTSCPLDISRVSLTPTCDSLPTLMRRGSKYLSYFVSIDDQIKSNSDSYG